MFIPGETVSHEFIIPFENTRLYKVVITYTQNDRIVLVKTIASASSFKEAGTGKTKITLAFTQAESLLFDDKSDYYVQLNVALKDSNGSYTGTRLTCTEFKGSTGKQHYKEVIRNG